MKMRLLVPIGLLMLALTGCATGPGGPPAATVASAASVTPAATAEDCRYLSREQVEGLFERWNRSLESRNVEAIVANYAVDSALLPTFSYVIRYTPQEKAAYFEHFILKKPSGKIDSRRIYLGCNSAIDVGDYTFTFGNGEPPGKARFTFTYRREGSQWLISSHHSSVRPTMP